MPKFDLYDWITIITTFFYSLIDVITSSIAYRLSGLQIYKNGTIITISFYEKNPLVNLINTVIGNIYIAYAVLPPIAVIIVSLSLYTGKAISIKTERSELIYNIFRTILFLVISVVYITVFQNNMAVLGSIP